MRGYFVHDVNEEYGIAIVARTAREAKKIGAEHLDFALKMTGTTKHITSRT